MTSETQAAGAAGATVWPEITISRGLGAWLDANRASIAFTSYGTGKLFLVGLLPTGVNVDQQFYQRAMGLSYDRGKLHLAALNEIWELEPVPLPPSKLHVAADLMLRPMRSYTTGGLDAHELGVDAEGELIFVNTKYCCLAKLDPVHSFRPVWAPPFISALEPEDRCHLNGLGMVDGRAKYVTAVSQTDTREGWRRHRVSGGILMDVPSGEVLADGFSMPHSPRAHGEGVLMLESGRGRVVLVDPSSGKKQDLAFCPGFLRGLAVHNGYALVTCSLAREGEFKGLALQQELEERKEEPWCGILVVSLATGKIAEWIRFHTLVRELFDVIVLPGVRCPASLGLGTPELSSTVTFEPL